MNASSFQAALTEHLDALQARDIDRFAGTVADDVTVVDGHANVVTGRDAVLRSHAGWFASADSWSFTYTIKLVRELGTAAFALIDVTYRQSPNAVAARFVLSLIFERTQTGVWKFVFDQNTSCSGSTG